MHGFECIMALETVVVIAQYHSKCMKAEKVLMAKTFGTLPDFWCKLIMLKQT